MVEVVIDAFGGDYSPEEIVLGSLNALKLNKEFNVVLTGDEHQTQHRYQHQSMCSYS